jgi:hypothetical protein
MAASDEMITTPRRPSIPVSLGSAPGKIMGANGHVSAKKQIFGTGIQVVDQDAQFKYAECRACKRR